MRFNGRVTTRRKGLKKRCSCAGGWRFSFLSVRFRRGCCYPWQRGRRTGGRKMRGFLWRCDGMRTRGRTQRGRLEGWRGAGRGRRYTRHRHSGKSGRRGGRCQLLTSSRGGGRGRLPGWRWESLHKLGGRQNCGVGRRGRYRNLLQRRSRRGGGSGRGGCGGHTGSRA
jgi:hypothetical protein